MPVACRAYSTYVCIRVPHVDDHIGQHPERCFQIAWVGYRQPCLQRQSFEKLGVHRICVNFGTVFPQPLEALAPEARDQVLQCRVNMSGELCSGGVGTGVAAAGGRTGSIAPSASIAGRSRAMYACSLSSYGHSWFRNGIKLASGARFFGTFASRSNPIDM